MTRDDDPLDWLLRDTDDHPPSKAPRPHPADVWAVVVLLLGAMALLGWVAWLVLA